ncbi:MAG: ribonuclease Y [Verrucomicrobiota bacterium]|nr:ribonuclease Y [Verrucomicrobiota bacterium]
MSPDLFAVVSVGLVGCGLGGGYLLHQVVRKRERKAREEESRQIVEDAHKEAETVLREARILANEEAAKLREETEKAFTGKRQALADSEQRLSHREALINQQLESLSQQERNLRQQQLQLEKSRGELEKQRTELQRAIDKTHYELERITHLSAADARAMFMREVEQRALKDATDLTRHIVEEAKGRAEEQARRIISLAIQRYAATHTFETTTATLALPGDEIKGRIIGREGRNIRAFEAATGITVLIDDTPNAVVLSGFDPVRREIAREAMQRLMADGRIHPTRIEEVVQQVTEEMDESIVKNAEEALFHLGLPPMHPEILKRLGSLKFRYSFSQNILSHSIEVAQLMALMAVELGVDVVQAKKAGLLHDIGKALNHEIEGSHALIGADFIKRYGENDDVVNGVASHHDEVPHTNLLGILVSAADAMSASRPGARSETMSTYLKRLENLERLGASFPGVEKCFAVQAGRELRVMVHPSEVNDDQAAALARSIVRKIEEELQYPGQIRVTVVRETRIVEFAK